jgi:hypothetical protein
MIPAPAGLVARYKYEDISGKPYWTHMRVVAFDDDSQPLVVDEETHQLDRASRRSNYGGISDTVDADCPDYTAVIPGGGWRVEYTRKDGSLYDEPLTGWAVKGGVVVPLVCDVGGVVEDLDRHTADDFRVYHPDARETPGT